MATAERIVLESEQREVPEFRHARKVHARVQVRTGLRQRRVELVLIDYYYLCVRTTRGRGAASEHVLDLRFLEPAPRLTGHVPWRCVGAAFAASLAAGASWWWIFSSGTDWLKHEWLPFAATLLCAALIGWVISAYRTTRTLTLRSVHGQANMLELTAHLGRLRALRRFSQLLAAHIKMAMGARRPRAEHLRDEMREHFRLKEAGVLSEEEYESGKARILSRHAPAT